MCGEQVSWCRLEVELASPKAIHSSPPGLAGREAPPLVVAALSLKTYLPSQVSLMQALQAEALAAPVFSHGSCLCCMYACMTFPGCLQRIGGFYGTAAALQTPAALWD